MPQPSVIHATFVMRASYPKPVEKVFAAFSDPAKKRRWFAEGENNDVELFELDFRTGGREAVDYRMKQGTPIAGALIANRGTYLDIVPGRRIVAASTMALDGRCFSASLVTFEFLETGAGTEIVCTHQGAFFEGSDGPQMREKGWQALFAKLEREVMG